MHKNLHNNYMDVLDIHLHSGWSLKSNKHTVRFPPFIESFLKGVMCLAIPTKSTKVQNPRRKSYASSFLCTMPMRVRGSWPRLARCNAWCSQWACI